jgi:hypothetical protein
VAFGEVLASIIDCIRSIGTRLINITDGILKTTGPKRGITSTLGNYNWQIKQIKQMNPLIDSIGVTEVPKNVYEELSNTGDRPSIQHITMDIGYGPII